MPLALPSLPQFPAVSQEFLSKEDVKSTLNCPPEAFAEINWALELGLQISVLERDITPSE